MKIDINMDKIFLAWSPQKTILLQVIQYYGLVIHIEMEFPRTWHEIHILTFLYGLEKY